MADAPVSPYLLYRDTGSAVDWISRAFGFTERSRMLGDDGRVAHAEIAVGQSVILLGQPGSEYRNPRDLGAVTMLVHIYVDDVDGLFQRAVDSGAEVVREPADQPYGDRNAALRDPEGHQWYIAQRLIADSP